MYAAQRTNGDLAAMNVKAGFRTPHSAFRIPHSAFCLLLLILGCGNVIEDGLPAVALPNDQAAEQPTPLEDRQALGDLLIDPVGDACWWMTSVQISHNMHILLTAKDDGATQTDAMIGSLTRCENEADTASYPALFLADCISCFLAMLDAVYP